MQRRPAQDRHLIEHESQIGEVRRAAQRLAAACGLDETGIGRVGIVAVELATNLYRHGGGGEILVQALSTGAAEAIELIALDRGRGMSNVERCLRDGYSTAGSPGTGLGAVQRLATEFDIYSVPGRGTVVMARVGAGAAPRVGAISVPLSGERECGDGWAVSLADDGIEMMVVDGLGHGSFAAQAAGKAQDAFAAAPDDGPIGFLERAHRVLGSTRGAAAAAACIGKGGVSYAGVGNIAGRLVGSCGAQGLVSHNGTLGVKINRLQLFEYTNEPGGRLVMHSDGISARWDLSDHEHLRERHPAVIAGVLYRDHARATDDATVLVVAS
jgi:anti-sigma regulatory factor (Ser/Thr protein kinase)